MEQEELYGMLKSVIDPELGVNIVDLGLVYEAKLEDGEAYVKMTLTTAGCPLHDMMVGGVKSALHGHPAIKNVNVEVVWSPPWTPSQMSDYAKRMLGYLE